jgi:subtilisin family serine protease
VDLSTISHKMDPLDVVKLTPLMELTKGRPEVTIGLLDGPVAVNHADLAGTDIREVPGQLPGTCAHISSAACLHGTFVAGILSAQRGAEAPAICPSCPLLVCPIFAETPSGAVPSAAPEALTTAIIATIDAGARVLNVSAAFAQPSAPGAQVLEEALEYALRRGVITVVAAGNQGMIGSTALTRHPWVIPVVACDLQGRPLRLSNLGSSLGRRGLSAPGANITSLGASGTPYTSGGTSAAAPFVTGAIALLWSLFPTATAAEVHSAIAYASTQRRKTIVPPLLDAWAAYQRMLLDTREGKP